jgi:hypothetical protein
MARALKYRRSIEGKIRVRRADGQGSLSQLARNQGLSFLIPKACSAYARAMDRGAQIIIEGNCDERSKGDGVADKM